MIYKITYTDDNGNLYDVQYCDSYQCLMRFLKHPVNVPESGKVEFGQVHDTDESDSDTYCGECDDLIRNGIGR